jgi:hypothetical protein
MLALVASAAQSRRAPTRDEAQVLTRFITAITSTVDPFSDANWQVDGGTFPKDASDASMSVHPQLPLDDCIGGDRTWSIRPNSPLFNARLFPLYERVKSLSEAMGAKLGAGQNASAETQEIQRINKQIKSVNKVTIDVCGNSPSIEAPALALETPSLLPGVIAHRVSPDVCGSDVAACYVLVYGDWKSARPSPSRDRDTYRFVNPPGSPYLENIVIRLKGADDRIQEMLKADWARVAQALGGPRAT